LPALNRLGARYAERWLAILAINVGESRSRYENYIQSQGYAHLHWGRDGSREVVSLYKVRGIPATYILDQEGVVRAAHIGYGASMEEVFAQEIESLLE
jgi:hypothetical protein